MSRNAEKFEIVTGNRVVERGLASKKEARHFVGQFKAFDRLLQQKRSYRIRKQMSRFKCPIPWPCDFKVDGFCSDRSKCPARDVRRMRR
jgi:hypothetical protein